MKAQHRSITVGVAILLLGVVVQVARALPPLPSSFYGTVKINGANVPAGTHVSAWIAGVQYAETIATIYSGDTVYSLNVPGDDPATPGIIEGGKQGDTIAFSIGGSAADQTGMWQSGTNVPLNLSRAGAPVPASITVEVVPAVLTANSGAAAIVTATVRDGSNQPIAGVLLSGSTIPSTLGAASLLSATNAAGQTIGTWTAGSIAGIGTLRVTDDTITTTIAITLNNPLPTIASLSPLTVTIGSPPFVLAITGTNFVSGSAIHWNGAALATIVVSSTQLQALIATDSILITGTVSLTVTNPPPGGGTSNVVALFVEGPSPAPKDKFIYLPIVTRGSPPILLRKQSLLFGRLSG